MPSYGDPLTAPFWAAAKRHEFVLQRCASCDTYQFYPRPFCLRCLSDAVEWVPSLGLGTIHSLTTVHVRVVPELDPPYMVALVQLDEGLLFTANVVGGPGAIGERVRMIWRERAGLPPLPVFEPIGSGR